MSVPNCPTHLENSGTRAYCAFSGCGWGLFGYLLSSIIFFFSVWGTTRCRLKYCLKGPFNQNQPTYCNCSKLILLVCMQTDICTKMIYSSCKQKSFNWLDPKIRNAMRGCGFCLKVPLHPTKCRPTVLCSFMFHE